ncbi:MULTISPECIES: ectoine synthase [Terasakiella]|uniref:L-ectoine synthase n=1 Tax=Terasakiella brassicae TaxID=1634917 RepID=A0A917C6Q2_9PROT|nr:ectoine synthase [Terasakiella brassicae]GGF73160.1 L-ectoine synthase [Terasakiella brassicae]
MIVRHVDEIKGTEREVTGDTNTWTSRRLLLRKDGMGFSFHETIIHAGTETLIWYKNHLEAVYCVGGEGEIEDLSDGKIHPISDGTMYALNGHEKHYLRAKTDLRMICVFTPALTGLEDHDADGVYPLIEDECA